jgi:hypothetical protein
MDARLIVDQKGSKRWIQKVAGTVSLSAACTTARRVNCQEIRRVVKRIALGSGGSRTCCWRADLIYLPRGILAMIDFTIEVETAV